MSASHRPTAYISYRWEGAKEHADRIAAGLTAELPELDVFQDSADLRPGDHWPTKLQEALSRASALLVLIDPGWLRHSDEYSRRKLDDERDWVRLEIEHALNRGIAIVPILLDNARLPPAEALPESLRPLTRFQTFSLDRKGVGDRSLFHHLKRILTASIKEGLRLPELGFQILNLELENFRCFEHLSIDFTQDSTLEGDWTCIAGLNGSGKSTVLQALAILMMGPDRARELGGRRLDSMRRLDRKQNRTTALLRARAQLAGEPFVLEMTLKNGGPQTSDHAFWSRAQDLLCVGYGASRNVSDTPDRYDDLSPIVSGFISLFDPMARLRSAETLFEHSGSDPLATGALLEFQALMAKIFEDEVTVVQSGSPIEVEFSTGGPNHGVMDLPDGFRSSVAWLADFCSRSVSLAPSNNESQPMLGMMSGLVMVDEIDLHLHASLQRAIVPRLRRALPKLQWIVTSHAPLVLASFDHNELILLDSNEADGIREFDRQIFGFSADEVYDVLLRTPPSSETSEETLAEALESGKGRRETLEAILKSTPDGSEEDSRARMTRIRERLAKIKP